MGKPRQFESYAEISQELQQLVQQARSKELSLEESLDIFEQALEYAACAIDLVDTSEFTLEEEQELQEKNRQQEQEEKEQLPAFDDEHRLHTQEDQLPSSHESAQLDDTNTVDMDVDNDR